MRLPLSLSSRSAVPSLVIIGAVCATVWAGARVISIKSAPHGSTAGSPASAAPVYRPAVRVWVHRDGVRPAVVRAEPGPVALHAENETGGDVALVFERIIPGRAVERAARVVTTRRGRRARRELVLGAGEYLFYEESRPELQGRLFVEERAR